MQYAPVVGRVLFSAIFIMFGMGHLFDAGSMTAMVPAFMPMKTAVVMLTGVVLVAGGLMVLVGYQAKLAGKVLFVFMFLTAITVWSGGFMDGDQTATAMFMKDLALSGASLMMAHFGAGPMSMDAKSGA